MSSTIRPGPARRGFLFDLNRCTGCSACELACSTENELGWGRSWRQVTTFNEDRRPGLPSFHLSLACNHCEAAPCVDQCPALAIGREVGSGTVQIDAQRCIGCRYCSWVCPFDAPRFDEEAGVMGKCTLCSHRLRDDRSPACVEGCPTSALRFGPLDGDEEVPGFPLSEAQPAIRFTPLLQGMRPPESTWSPDPGVVASFASARGAASTAISLRSEWPLLVFTLLAAFLAGWVLAAVLGGPEPPLAVFAGGAALAMVTSTLHLGRKARAWRAILNLRRSWLSREVAAFGAFATLAVAYLLAGGAAERGAVGSPGGAAAGLLGAGAALAGLACLFCIDRVYDPVRGSRRFHSADTLVTGLLLAAILLGRFPSAVALSAVKAVLYIARELLPPGTISSGSRAGSRRFVRALLRLGAGLGVPLAVLAALPDTMAGLASETPAGKGALLALASFALGEVIDRIHFYRGLAIPTPRRTTADAVMALAADPTPVAR